MYASLLTDLKLNHPKTTPQRPKTTRQEKDKDQTQRQDKTRQDKRREEKRRDKNRDDKTRHKTRQDKNRNKTRQDMQICNTDMQQRFAIQVCNEYMQ